MCVFAPSPILTVSTEPTTAANGDADIHLHAGGQGFWVARMLAEFDLDVVLCVSLGGETGTLLSTLIPMPGVTIVDVDTVGWNGGYVHDRRSGERQIVATMAGGALTRHELDDLYGVTLAEAMASDATVLTGPQGDDIIPDDVYRRLAADHRGNGGRVVADLSGGRLDAVLAGGVDLLKVSEEELEQDGRLARAGSLAAAIRDLEDAGAVDVVVTCGDEHSVASADGHLIRVTSPAFEPLDPRGAGDSFTAAMTAAVVSDRPVLDALRAGAAAGAMNVSRHGLASGRGDLIERMARLVTIEAYDDDGADTHDAGAAPEQRRPAS